MTTNIDPRLESDSVHLGTLQLCDVRLAKDARWPWLILVPKTPNITELHELSVGETETLAHETRTVSKVLKEITGCTKINSAAIGNVVSQLHIHVVARNEGDPNWPKPIWGFETPESYGELTLQEFVNKLQSELF